MITTKSDNGLMDVSAIINSLNPNIPVFLDKLRIFKDSEQSKVIAGFIKKQHPNFIDQYIDIINNGDESYYSVLENEYINNSRIKFLFNATD